MIELARPLASLDQECTSLDLENSRIIEIGISVLYPDGRRTNWAQRFCPECPIPPESTAIHGITDADVANCPRFSEHASIIHHGLAGKDILGYNARRLDLPLLDQELRRCGLKLDLTGVQVIDAFGIFSKKESRTLADAVQKYCGRPHEGAHGAGADAAATLDVLAGELATYTDLNAMSIEELAKFSVLGDFEPADIAGKLYRKGGQLYWAFGKYKDRPVLDDMGYVDWFLSKSFWPGSTKEVIQAEIDKVSGQETLSSVLSDALR